MNGEQIRMWKKKCVAWAAAAVIAPVAALCGPAVAAPAGVGLPGFQQKVCVNGEPLAQKPGVLADFIELRHARGFTRAVFQDLEGRPVPLEGFAGKLVMVDLWATWCEPCLRTLPAILKLQQRYNRDPASDIRIVSISIDEKSSTVKRFLKRRNLEGFTTLIDPEQRIGDDMPIDVIPSVFMLDGQGHLIGFVRGFIDWSDDAVRGYLAALAAKYAKRKCVAPR